MKTYIVTMNDGKTFTVRAENPDSAKVKAFYRTKENMKLGRCCISVRLKQVKAVKP